MRDQQHAVEPVVIARLVGATDFVLQRENHCVGITKAVVINKGIN